MVRSWKRTGREVGHKTRLHVPTRYLCGTNKARSSMSLHVARARLTSEALPGFLLSRTAVREELLFGQMTMQVVERAGIRGPPLEFP